MPPKLYSKAHCLPSSTPSGHLKADTSTPELYVDTEGISLSRHGELSILIVHIETATFSHTYLLHVHVLGRPTFYMKSSCGKHSLKTIFEDNRIPKVLFDCRMDSDAMFGQFGVLLGGAIDLQLMYLATRGGGPRGLPGLEACLLTHLNISGEERAWVTEAKARGQKLWRPRCGGRMAVFNDNPLHPDIVNYCVVDAAYLPQLYKIYNAALGNRVSLMALDTLWGNKDAYELANDGDFNPVFTWRRRIIRHTAQREAYSLLPAYTGGTGHNPWWIPDYDDYDDDDY